PVLPGTRAEPFDEPEWLAGGGEPGEHDLQLVAEDGIEVPRVGVDRRLGGDGAGPAHDREARRGARPLSTTSMRRGRGVARLAVAVSRTLVPVASVTSRRARRFARGFASL